MRRWTDVGLRPWAGMWNLGKRERFAVALVTTGRTDETATLALEAEPSCLAAIGKPRSCGSAENETSDGPRAALT